MVFGHLWFTILKSDLSPRWFRFCVRFGMSSLNCHLTVCALHLVTQVTIIIAQYKTPFSPFTSKEKIYNRIQLGKSTTTCKMKG